MHNNGVAEDRSATNIDGLSIDGLSSEQQDRLTQILDQYLSALESGDAVDVAELLGQNEDLADVLKVYLQKLDQLRGVAPGFQDHGELEPLVSGQSPNHVNSLVLGDFTIIREIGRGGMGIVYEATQRSLDRRVALKLLPLASMLDGRQISRFKNESHAAAQLQHPNIVPVYSVAVERGIHFYAMQLIDGQTVDAWIESTVDVHSKDQWRETVQMVISAADALHCAHECGVVHRDIKPSNLMIDRTGKTWVTDFGLARCQDDRSLTLSGNVVGTMRYMSPEQASGRSETVDHRTDIYSLGTTLYEMLTGQAAIEGTQSPSVLHKISHDSPTKLRRITKQLPADLEVVVHKAMSKNKDDRYASALEFADDLQAVIDGRPTMAKPPSMTKLATTWAVHHHRLVAAALAVCLFGAIGVMVSSFLMSQKDRDVLASYERADIYFRRAQEVVDHLGSRVATQLASVPGAEHIRLPLLHDTLDYYQDFVAQAEGDPQLKAQLAITHSRIGDLIQELESPSLSIQHYQRSEELFGELEAQSPDVAILAQQRAHNLDQLGLACLAAGDPVRAEQSLLEAIKIQVGLLGKAEQVEIGTDLARAKANLGLLLSQTGRAEQSREQLMESVNHFREAIERDESNVLAARGMAAALGTLSSLSLESRPVESIQLLNQAIDLQLRVAKIAPSKLIASREIANTYNSLGSALLGNSQVDEAVKAFANSVSIHRRLHAIAPMVDGYRSDLAMSLNNLATSLHQQGENFQANQMAMEAVALQRNCLKEDTPSASSLSWLAVMLNNLGTTHEQLAQVSLASDAYEKAVEHQQRAIEIERDSIASKEYLLQHFSNLLRMQVRSRSMHEAAATSLAYRQAATTLPSKLVDVAEELARLSLNTESPLREQLAADSSRALQSAREAKVALDPRMLKREPFRSLADAGRPTKVTP